MRTSRIRALEALLGLVAAACTSDTNGQKAGTENLAGTLPCDVAHLLEQHCVMCHGVMPRNGAPHSLLTPSDFQKDEGGQTLGQIAVFLVQNPIRRMPPPPNAPLTPDEIGILQRWVTSGTAAVAEGCGVREATGAAGNGGASGSAGTPAAGGLAVGAGGAPGGAVAAGGTTFAAGAAGVATSGGAPPNAGGSSGAAGAAGTSGTGGAAPLSSNWSMFGGDLANSRTNAATHLSASSVGSFHRVWQFQGPAVTSTPAVVDGVVYFSGWDAKVYAVHATDGSKVWTTTVPHLVDSSPSVTADRVFVGDNNGIVSALDRTTGSVVWSKPAETAGLPHLWSSPMVLPDVNLVVVGVASAEESNAPGKAFTFRGSVSALDAATGDPRWQFYTSNNDSTSGPGVGVWSTACVDPALKLLYVGSGNAYQTPAGPYTDSLLAIHYDTGKLEWAHQFQTGDVFEVYTTQGVDSDVGSSANLFSAGGKDLVGVGVKNGTYYALDRKTGTVVWQRHVSMGSVLGGIMGASAYANGVVFVAGNEGMSGKTTAMALNAADGSVLWTFSAPATTYAALAVAGSVVYLGTTGGVLYGIDAATGKQIWSDNLPNGTAGGVSVGENLIFAPWGFYFTLLNGTDPGKGGLVAYGP